MSRKRRHFSGPKLPPKPRPRSWLWVLTDDPAKRIVPHEATIALARDEGGAGATVDLFVERGGKEFTGLTVQALRVRGASSIRELVGHDVIDPPPVLMGIAPLEGPMLGRCAGGVKLPSPLRKLGLGLESDLAPRPDEAPDNGDDALSEAELEAEEAAPDDDPALGDWDTYVRRRAEEGKLAPPEVDPELDEEALAEAEAAAAAERVLIAPGQAYEVEAIRVRVRALEADTAELDIEGRCAEIGADGEVVRSGVPFGGKVFARVEEG